MGTEPHPYSLKAKGNNDMSKNKNRDITWYRSSRGFCGPKGVSKEAFQLARRSLIMQGNNRPSKEEVLAFATELCDMFREATSEGFFAVISFYKTIESFQSEYEVWTRRPRRSKRTKAKRDPNVVGGNSSRASTDFIGNFAVPEMTQGRAKKRYHGMQRGEEMVYDTRFRKGSKPAEDISFPGWFCQPKWQQVSRGEYETERNAGRDTMVRDIPGKAMQFYAHPSRDHLLVFST